MVQVQRTPFDGAGFREKYGPWAVIAGASDGTGEAFAEQLAELGINLVLVSRRPAVLEELGRRLAAAHGISYRVIVADLTHEGATARLVEETADLDVGLYVSNAGVVGDPDTFLDTPLETSLSSIRMNVQNLAIALHGFGRRLRERGRGGLVVMSSGSALGGIPLRGNYAATKSYGLVIAESMWGELADDGVDVIAVVAPTMDTPTLRRGPAGNKLAPEDCFSAADVSHEALARLGTDPTIVFAGMVSGPTTTEIEQERRRRVEGYRAWAKTFLGSKAEA